MTTPDLPTKCVVAEAPWSGAASLALVSAFHGITVSPGEVAELSQMAGAGSNAEATALIMARALGFEAVAMEGGYGDLPDVVLPLLVALREGEQERYGVLFAFDDERATVGDPLTGDVFPWPRERFTAVWTGSVIQVTPVGDERKALPARLLALRDTVGRALSTIGWAPPYRPRIAMLLAWGALAAIAAAAPHGSGPAAAWTWLVAAACAGSLWSWLASDTCALCSYAKRLAGGLPVAEAGVALYAALVASAYVTLPVVVTSMALGVAIGSHAALVRTLATARLTCWACLFVAACAAGAAAAALVAGTAEVIPFAAGSIVAAVGVSLLLPRARAKQERTERATAEAIATRVLAEPRPDGVVRVVAFTRVGCPTCAFFHAAVKPALVATFAEAITLEERALTNEQTAAPLLVIIGAQRTLLIGLPGDDPCANVLETVKRTIEWGGPPSEALVVKQA
jgi:hypothetical protein